MRPELVLSPQGIVIAIVFAAAVGTVMIWMFRVPRPVSEDVAKARRSLDIARLILVPTIGAAYSQRGVELACRLAQEHGAEILLVYIVEVPRTLPLGAVLPEAEQEAEEALKTASEVVMLHNLPVDTYVQRAREAGDGIISAAKDRRADLIVMGIASRSHASHLWGRTADALLHRAPCEVIFDKLPE
jgi:nucleotide-binding universal stress UspA family protein